MGVVPLNSVDPATGDVSVTGGVPVTNVRKRKKHTNINNALRPGFKPYAVKYSLTVNISREPTISFVD